MHFTVVYLVGKPLIWSEVKRDKLAEVVDLLERGLTSHCQEIILTVGIHFVRRLKQENVEV